MSNSSIELHKKNVVELENLFKVKSRNEIEIFLKQCGINDSNLWLYFVKKIYEIDDKDFFYDLVINSNIISSRQKFDLIMSRPDRQERIELFANCKDVVALHLGLFLKKNSREDVMQVLKIILEREEQYNQKHRINQEDGISAFINEIIEKTDCADIRDCISEIKEIFKQKYFQTPMIFNTINKELEQNKYGQLQKLSILVGLFQNDEFAKTCLNNAKSKLNEEQNTMILKSILDKEYVKQYIMNSGMRFASDKKKELIIDLHDVEFSIMCLKNELLNLSSTDKQNIILNTADDFSTMCGIGISEIEFIKRCLKDKMIKLDNINKVFLLIEIDDIELIKKYIVDESNGLDKIDRAFLKIYVEYDKSQRTKGKRKCGRNLLNLGTITAGIEIECLGGKFDKYIYKLKEELCLTENDFTWNFDLEHTCSGIEVKSYVFDNNELGTESIHYVCDILNEIGQEVNGLTGGHIHIGTKYLTKKESYINLINIFANCEEIFFIISNEAGAMPRESSYDFARPISKKLNEAILYKKFVFSGNETKEEFVKKIKSIQGDRCSSINFLNVGKKDKDTIEFRIPNGTLSSQVWIDNINLYAGLVKISEELAIIQAKNECDRTEEEKKKLKLFDRCISGRLSEGDKLECLLQLCIDNDEYRQEYRRRYSENSIKFCESCNKESSTEKKLKNSICKSFIGFNQDDIEKVTPSFFDE